MNNIGGNFDDQEVLNIVNDNSLAINEVKQAVGNTKANILRPLFGNSVNKVLNILGIGGTEDPSELVEELAAYRAEAMKTLENKSANDNNEEIKQIA